VAQWLGATGKLGRPRCGQVYLKDLLAQANKVTLHHLCASMVRGAVQEYVLEDSKAQLVRLILKAQQWRILHLGHGAQLLQLGPQVVITVYFVGMGSDSM